MDFPNCLFPNKTKATHSFGTEDIGIMNLKRILILAPIVLILVLLQSYFWVPTYESQTTGNPERVRKFIEASIGDAKILNPILNADSSSSRIVGLVFEGLLDYDEELSLRSRLATKWTISETAYLIVNAKKFFPDKTPVTVRRLESRIKKAIAQNKLKGLKDLVTDIQVISSEERKEKISIPGDDGKPIEIEVSLQIPERIKFSLREVDQDFFDRLSPVLGEHYEQNPPYQNWIRVNPQEKREEIEKHFSVLLPIFEHNPIILFHLRDNVFFHDGHPFDAGDVKFTYESIMNPKNLSPRTSDFEPIKKIDVLDPLTVRVVYKRLFSPAINAWIIGILPEHLLNDTALTQEMNDRNLSETAREQFGMRDSKFNRAPIGIGPFQFEDWQSDELIYLTRYQNYWEGPPEYKEFYFRVIPDPLTQEVEFKTGAIDSYGALPYQAARYKKDEKYQSFSSLNFGYSYIGYNNRRDLFSDKRVRRALGMAINVDEIIKYILYHQGEGITGPFPKNTVWYDQKIKPLPFDPQGALQILENLGWEKNKKGLLEKNGKIFEFNLITNNGNPIRKDILIIAQDAWKKIGIKCNTQVFEWAVFLEDFVNKGEFDALVLGWNMGPDPDLYQLWHSSQSGRNQLNFVGYNNPKADNLITRIRQEYNTEEQRKLAHNLHKVVAEDQPYTFLFTRITTPVLDKKIVMLEDDGAFSKIKPAKSGDVFFYFNRWKKLEFTPAF